MSVAMKPTVAMVPIKPAWMSKINIVAVLGIIGAVLSIWAIPFPEELQKAVQVVFEVGVPLVIMVFRTWFSTSVVSNSVSGATVVPPSTPVGAAGDARTAATSIEVKRDAPVVSTMMTP